eukprot:CAMPEP_0179212374 /NCGR_PEP_ID=MMETSP0797-20121207/1078_1 /TAXON_ID=47934 /ORGANISM="Dinophysis acuminata, Strain DAEP01" /LENGTH=183 /DNA_ID=CAMNT_0020917995 /DNA_START=346 /DNA_END=894 /DNA_ORIENTATION=-
MPDPRPERASETRASQCLKPIRVYAAGLPREDQRSSGGSASRHRRREAPRRAAPAALALPPWQAASLHFRPEAAVYREAEAALPARAVALVVGAEPRTPPHRAEVDGDLLVLVDDAHERGQRVGFRLAAAAAPPELGVAELDAPVELDLVLPQEPDLPEAAGVVRVRVAPLEGRRRGRAGVPH